MFAVHNCVAKDSLKALKNKGQRTVYRLTLVKGWNTEEVKAYAELLDLGQPDFIEIKGVTYCGSYVFQILTRSPQILNI